MGEWQLQKYAMERRKATGAALCTALVYHLSRRGAGNPEERAELSGRQIGTGGFQESFIVLVKNLLHPLSGLEAGSLQRKHPLCV